MITGVSFASRRPRAAGKGAMLGAAGSSGCPSPPPRPGAACRDNGNGANGTAPSTGDTPATTSALLHPEGGANGGGNVAVNGSAARTAASGSAPVINGGGAAAAAAAAPPPTGSLTLFPLHAPSEVFLCPEESLFYSQCIEKLVLSRSDRPSLIAEFGAGDGSPVLSALLKAPHFSGTVNAWELNAAAARLAASNAAQVGLAQRYRVHNRSFFEDVRSRSAECLIANPPYLPAPDRDIMLPDLCGGNDGSTLTRSMLGLGFERAMLLISAYSNPVDTLADAQAQGYSVADFMVTPLPFGRYSSEPKVRRHIHKLRAEGKAFCTQWTYLLAGVLLCKRQQGGVGGVDLSQELLRVLTSF